MILQAALAIGGAQHALDITVQYAKDREQFDKPLGAFQALAHYLADAKTTSTAAPCWSTRRPGPAPRAARSTGWPPWPSCSRARPTAT